MECFLCDSMRRVYLCVFMGFFSLLFDEEFISMFSCSVFLCNSLKSLPLCFHGVFSLQFHEESLPLRFHGVFFSAIPWRVYLCVFMECFSPRFLEEFISAFSWSVLSLRFHEELTSAFSSRVLSAISWRFLSLRFHEELISALSIGADPCAHNRGVIFAI